MSSRHAFAENRDMMLVDTSLAPAELTGVGPIPVESRAVANDTRAPNLASGASLDPQLLAQSALREINGVMPTAKDAGALSMGTRKVSSTLNDSVAAIGNVFGLKQDNMAMQSKPSQPFGF